ncbi:hypothetical protein Pgy4_41234, partial [Pseudomonas savastanoi pv. glycinea str. race 4]
QADFLLRGYGFTAGELLSGPGDLATLLPCTTIVTP